MEIDVFNGKIFRVTIQEYPGGLRYERVYSRSGVTIFPVTQDGRIRCIELKTTEHPQPRVTFLHGYIENGEEPLACAKRELAEELGLSAVQWTLFMTAGAGDIGGSIFKTQYIFIARDLRPFNGRSQQDPHEEVTPVDLSLGELKAKVLAQKFGAGTDAFAFLKFAS